MPGGHCLAATRLNLIDHPLLLTAMKKYLPVTLLFLLLAGHVKSQCPANAYVYTSQYPQCAEGCGVLLRDWPEGVLVYVYGGNPLTVVTSVQIPGVLGGPGTGNAFVCVPCNIPLVFASTVPGATSGCVIVYLGVLPVSLTSFSASAGNGNSPVINWTAASDTRDVVYTIQRSMNNDPFTDLYSINGRGGQDQSYRFTDESAGTGKIRYRLKYQDDTGTPTYSNIISVRTGKSGIRANIYPNPSNKNFNLRIDPISLPATLQLFNTSGQLIESRTITNPLTEIGSRLNKGVYALRLSDKNHYTDTQILVKE